ncbi:MAG: EF-hand domain-containing protein [Phycisphaeraceae bacterium]|nr:EF-hand domain-containing protein [Phycisphaerae bacterium]MBX3391557.1 EF-hand domain-containing protein [Phycisphaeraceae bacterium]HRJ49225.1 EF-hand domain-containing protein [Phycisphaerales bacterium]
MSLFHRLFVRLLGSRVVGFAPRSSRFTAIPAVLMVPALAVWPAPPSWVGSTHSGSSTALAQVRGEVSPPSRSDLESPVVLGELPTLWVTSLGYVEYLEPIGQGGGGDPRSCEVISTHTDANFEGGSFVIQAGFAENEVAAAQYTIPSNSFPIRIDTTEVIVAQQNAIVPTTTKWTMLFWSGRPDTGTLVASYSSDGVLLPHITMPPGTNGTNLLFGIDPSDPEQIIINAPGDGSNTFTIGFRIDDHNQQVGSGCSSGDIPSNRNAFPTTDVSGLAQPTLNWLKGINCGPFGCPPNGGWVRFSNLNSLCRPSGDWVMRAKWTSLNCQPGVGACCLPSGQCQVTTIGLCQSQAGQYQGDNSSCGPETCPAPTGACCFSNNFCLTLKEVDCQGAGGTWLGPATACVNNQCPSGACCLPLGNCVTSTQAACLGQGGTFQGVGSSCQSTNCPQPSGACCLGNGFCLSLSETECLGLPDATFKGPLTTCVDGNGNGTADICETLCPADFDQSGFVDIEDYTSFVMAFELGDDSADFDESGFVDIEDFVGFVLAFEEGC